VIFATNVTKKNDECFELLFTFYVMKLKEIVFIDLLINEQEKLSQKKGNA
jgi:hypothetical protein